MKRSTKKLVVYISLAVGTAVLAFMCVLFSGMIFNATESALFGETHYIPVNIVSSSHLGEPLSLQLRLELFNLCNTEGEQRLPLPGELTSSEAAAIGLSLWQDQLLDHADEGGTLKSQDLVTDLLDRASVSTKLRDFYTRGEDSKLALWCVQVYCQSSFDKQTYCLTAELDSCTGEPYSLTLALFSNMSANTNALGFESFARALKLTNDSARPTINEVDGEATVTLSLGNGLAIKKHIIHDEQFYMRLMFEP